MLRNSLLVALVTALAACGPSDPVPEADSGAGASEAARDLAAGAKIVVDANGVGAKGAPMRFGTARAAVDAALAKATGSAPESSSNQECGAGPMQFSQFGPLQVGYQDGKLAGWFLGQGAAVATSDGIVPGTTTLDALKATHPVQQLDTTIEGEFQYTAADYGTITGFAEPDGTITGLAAGVTCVFR